MGVLSRFWVVFSFVAVLFGDYVLRRVIGSSRRLFWWEWSLVVVFCVVGCGELWLCVGCWSWQMELFKWVRLGIGCCFVCMVR